MLGQGDRGTAVESCSFGEHAWCCCVRRAFGGRGSGGGGGGGQPRGPPPPPPPPPRGRPLDTLPPWRRAQSHSRSHDSLCILSSLCCILRRVISMSTSPLPRVVPRLALTRSALPAARGRGAHRPVLLATSGRVLGARPCHPAGTLTLKVRHCAAPRVQLQSQCLQPLHALLHKPAGVHTSAQGAPPPRPRGRQVGHVIHRA